MAKTILYVDDDRACRLIASRILSNQGYDVRVASSGREAIELARNLNTAGNLDLIISDVHMPQMNGLEMVNHIREFSSAPILFVSGTMDMQVRDYLRAEGISLLDKPYMPKVLCENVQDALNKN